MPTDIARDADLLRMMISKTLKDQHGNRYRIVEVTESSVVAEVLPKQSQLEEKTDGEQ